MAKIDQPFQIFTGPREMKILELTQQIAEKKALVLISKGGYKRIEK